MGPIFDVYFIYDNDNRIYDNVAEMTATTKILHTDDFQVDVAERDFQGVDEHNAQKNIVQIRIMFINAEQTRQLSD